MIFEGKKCADKKLEELKIKFERLSGSHLPKAVVIQIGENGENKKYLELKRKAFEKVGVELSLVDLTGKSFQEILHKINKLNKDDSVAGIMIQLPINGNFSSEGKKRIIDSISLDKDFDGMRGDSPFTTPTVLAVMEVLKKASASLRRRSEKEKRAVVVGAKGFMGGKLVKKLKELGYEVTRVDLGDDLSQIKSSDIVVSVVGKESLVRSKYVKEGAVLIDLGFPKSDFEAESYQKASFVSPSPGGVGPITIYFLVENFYNALQ